MSAAVEVYAFTSLVLVRLSFILFLAWAFLPNSVIEALGILYYPTKDWAIILPAWTLISLLMVTWLYQSLNICDASTDDADDSTGS